MAFLHHDEALADKDPSPAPCVGTPTGVRKAGPADCARSPRAKDVFGLNIVPGIGCSPDKMLQARIFSYADAHRDGNDDTRSRAICSTG